jgi:hypothetical protein
MAIHYLPINPEDAVSMLQPSMQSIASVLIAALSENPLERFLMRFLNLRLPRPNFMIAKRVD